MEFQDTALVRRSFPEKLHAIPQQVSFKVQRFFYVLGHQIARKPKKWIIGSSIFVLICLAGFLRFRQERNPLKLWVPPESDFVRDTEWIMSSFGEGQIVENLIFSAEDVLEPKLLVQLNEIIKRIINAQSYNNVSWTDVCFKVPQMGSAVRKKREDVSPTLESTTAMSSTVKPGYDRNIHIPSFLYCGVYNSFPKACLMFAITDLWNYDSDLIASQTKDEIIEKINTIKVSPSLGHHMNFSELFGGITVDGSGRIVSAKVVKTQWMVHVNFAKLDMDDLGNNAGTADWSSKEIHDWESAYLKELSEISKDLTKRNQESQNGSYSIYYEAGRSFSDITHASIFQDVEKLAFGVIFMSLYVQIILSKLNWVEWRFHLTSVALLCIGGAFIVTVGFCSLIGIPYGPVHTSLPFMLMGLGVDDTFIMMAAWKEIAANEKYQNKLIHEKVALALSHAGAAITVTSMTDVVAFIIGASTILPSLNSFCIYAAVGVFITFILQVTVFVAFFAIDAKRISEKRNCVVPCIKHENFKLSENFKEPASWKVFDWIYSNIVLTVPGKLAVIIITVIFASFGIAGSYQLEQWFDVTWFLPKESYLSEYLVVNKEQYPYRGHPASVFMSELNVNENFLKIYNLSQTLQNSSFVESVKDWPSDFSIFTDANFDIDLMTDNITKDEFSYYLSKFLFSQMGGKYQRNFRFHGNLICGENAPEIFIVTLDFTFVRFYSPYEWIPGMDGAKQIASEANLDGFVTVWSEVFASWVTDKVISQEVIRNIILALICVMGTTAFLIAEPQTCTWILLCVLLTLLDVCGFMFFLGLTIDIVSCIGLELAVGLSVDYASHVAHAFLNAESPEDMKNDRSFRALSAMRHIGAAVLYGAGSTFFALMFLGFSKAYVFRTFFKIFFLVILFGLWHGLLLLPVILSSIGPRSLRISEQEETKNIKAKDQEF